MNAILLNQKIYKPSENSVFIKSSSHDKSQKPIKQQ